VITSMHDATSGSVNFTSICNHGMVHFISPALVPSTASLWIQLISLAVMDTSTVQV